MCACASVLHNRASRFAIFNDATGRMADRLTHLYTGAGRYWYDTQPNLRRTMEDRAVNLEPEKVETEILRRLRRIQGRGDFRAVHPCPTSADVPDEPATRLVILPPETGHRTTQRDSAALIAATKILDKRGDIPRTYRNMLIFVAPDVNHRDPLESEVRRYLAWDSIIEDADELNLDTHQRREALRGKDQSNETLGMRLNEAYCWLLVPTQEGTEPIEWEVTRMPGPQENPVAKAVKKVQSDEQLISQWSPTLLRMELDQWLWKEESHISLKRVWECLATYLYLPRPRDSDVLLATVREGVQTQEFGYANGVDTDGRYGGLQFESASGSIYLDEQSVLVKPDVAKKQLAADVPPPGPEIDDPPGPPYTPGENGRTTPPLAPPDSPPKRFYGSINLDPIRAARDAQRIIEEVVQYLTSLPNSTVEVTMDIQAVTSDGVPDNIVRTITENCRTLGFTSQGFEEE